MWFTAQEVNEIKDRLQLNAMRYEWDVWDTCEYAKRKLKSKLFVFFYEKQMNVSCGLTLAKMPGIHESSLLTLSC